MSKGIDPAKATLDVKNSTLKIDSERFKTMMARLTFYGMPPAQARFHAANSLSTASFSDLADAFDVTKGSISSAGAGAESTMTDTKELFIQFVDGAKEVLHKTRWKDGDNMRTEYIAEYAEPGHHYNPGYCVIELVGSGGGYDMMRGFESFEIERYDDLEEIADELYNSRVFEDVDDAYEMWQMFASNGVSKYDLSLPTDRLTDAELENIFRESGKLYRVAEESDVLATLESWDGPIKYDGEFVDVFMGSSGLNSYSIRAESGAEIAHFEDREYAPEVAELYEEVGTVPRR